MKGSKMSIVAIIPARSGSKGIPHKNIIQFGGYPLIAYSIIAAKLSKRISRVIVSTDSVTYAQIAKKYGAEVPFLRPKKFAKDSSTDKEFVVHALEWFKKNEGHIPDYLVHLRPTAPLRKPEYIDRAIKIMTKNKQATSLRSAHEAPNPPQKYFSIKEKFFSGIFPEDVHLEYHCLPRQLFPLAYEPNSYVDILKSSVVLQSKGLHGTKILPFITSDTGDVDSISEMQYLTFLLHAEQWEIYEYLKDHFRS